VKFPIPDGYCLLGPDKPGSRSFLDAVRARASASGLQPLVVFADCAALGKRAGVGGPVGYGGYFALVSAKGDIHTLPPGRSPDAYLEAQARRSPPFDLQAVAAAPAPRGAAAGGVQFGLVRRDEGVNYLAALDEAPIYLHGSMPARQATIVGFTFVSNLPVYAMISELGPAAKSYKRLLALDETLVRALRTENEPGN
jgi:hypothetical protein